MILQGKDFMIYFEYDTGNGIIKLPYCSAETVTLEIANDLQEATKQSDSDWKSYVSGMKSYTLQIDSLVQHSLPEVQKILLNTVSGLVTDNAGEYISVGQKYSDLTEIGYYDLETKLLNNISVNWMMRNAVYDYITYSGNCLISKGSQTFTANDFVKGSMSFQGVGKINRTTLPVPYNLQHLGLSNAPIESASIQNIGNDTGTGIITRRFSITGVPLMNGIFRMVINTVTFNHSYKPGESNTEILSDLANQINGNQNVQCGATVNGNEIDLSLDSEIPVVVFYVNTTDTVKQVGFQFQVSANFSAYTIKIINNTDNETYLVAANSISPQVDLSTSKSYAVSVMGYDYNGMISDYSQPLNITI